MLSDQTTDFFKFLGIVIILFCGFLTTFTMLARGDFTPSQVLWIMINVCVVYTNRHALDANDAARSFLGEAWTNQYLLNQWLMGKWSSTSTGL